MQFLRDAKERPMGNGMLNKQEKERKRVREKERDTGKERDRL